MNTITQQSKGSRSFRANEFDQRSSADPFLPPIENPSGPIKKLIYFFTRRQFGKVLTPVKIVTDRMPAAFGFFAAKISKLDQKLTLSAETIMLVREQVARIKVCLFCIDIGRLFAIKASMNEAKFDAIEDYRASALFSDAERALLDYVTDCPAPENVPTG